MSITVYPWLQAQWDEILQRTTALPHALLFHGREGIGKLEFVRLLAQSLACLTPDQNGAACGNCQSCRWFAAGAHPDYREIVPEILRPDAESAAGERKPSQQISVDDVRGLHDFINLTGHQVGGKTIVFYPAETLNVNAANALLKSLEEPPPATRFMLVAHRPSYLPATVISRCQQVALPTPASAVAEQWLREQGVAEPALSLAQTGNAPLAARDLNDGEYWSQRKSLLANLAAPGMDAFSLAEAIRDFPLPRLLGWLQRWSYDLLSAKSCGRVRYNPDYAKPLGQLAARLRAVDIARFHRTLVRQQRSVHHPLNARLYIEQLLFSYAALLRGEDLADSYAR
ncbi:MAG: DNA polymerase III subunit delta' [Burkholderiales bacterium]